MNETDKAWMAGFVDGEGCLTIACQSRKNRPSPAYRGFITVSNTNRKVLEFFLEQYGGAIYHTHEKRSDIRKVRWADAYAWHCPASASSRFLTDILPYLRVKRMQAEIIIEFYAKKARQCNPRLSNGQWGGSEHLTEEELSRREKWRSQIQALNSKGQNARIALSLPTSMD